MMSSPMHDVRSFERRVTTHGGCVSVPFLLFEVCVTHYYPVNEPLKTSVMAEKLLITLWVV